MTDAVLQVEGLTKRRFGVIELHSEFVSRALEILPTPHGRLGVSGIGEMVGVVNAGAVLLGFDLAVELGCDALELCDHHLDLCHPPAPLIDLKPLEADERLT